MSVILLFLFLVHSEAGAQQAATVLPDIVVTPTERSLSPRRRYTIESVDVVKKDRIDKAAKTSLNDAVDRMSGVDSQDYCVNCGAKRISINGLRGDHTSVLIDGIPLYSAVTSVYGYDAIPMQSVSEIEVNRGTGAALLNPEAIGGSINILTLEPTKTGSRASVLMGERGTKTYELLHNQVGDKYKLSFGGEFGSEEAWDVDNNAFAESPFKQRYSGFLKQIWNMSPSTRWTTRFSHANLQIIGGNTSGFKNKSPISVQASDTDFVGGDVRKPFQGDVSRISEYVQVRRTEATSKLNVLVDGRNSLEWNLAGALYDQESFYMHGYDYHTSDKTLYTDVNWRRELSESQIATIGSSFRRETLRSESRIMYERDGVAKDDFNYSAYSLFGRHEWSLSDKLELSSALRLERLESRWLQLKQIDREVISPRLLLKWQHNDHWSQQFAYGQGYRMPLTSIESAHGAYDGFVIDITELEKSHSLVYTLSFNTPSFYLTPSVHYTRLENMSYPTEPATAHSGPLRFVSDSQAHDIFVYDILTGGKPTPHWLLEAGYERYSYPNSYKSKLPTAAIEERVLLRSEYERKGYAFVVSATWIGARNLHRYYQYSDHYNVSDGLLGVSEPKRARAPAFWQVDTSLSKKIGRAEVTAGVQNIFDYTQTKAGDSPAMWHSHDGHTHLDNRHVWGPNRGREIYVKLAYEF